MQRRNPEVIGLCHSNEVMNPMNQSNMMFRPVSFEASMLQMLVTVARIDSCPRWPKHLDLPRYGMPRPHSSLLWGWLTHFIMDAFLAFLFLFLLCLSKHYLIQGDNNLLLCQKAYCFSSYSLNLCFYFKQY